MEWILILVAVVAIFFISVFARKKVTPKLQPKTRLLLLFLWFLFFVVYMLHITTSKSFTTFQVIVLITFAIGYLAYFYFRYKK